MFPITLKKISDQPIRFLVAYFFTFSISYGLLYFFDFLPEPTKGLRDVLSVILIFGIISGLLQLLGYIDYYGKAIRNEIDPNPLMWLIFAYGTGLLTILEVDIMWEAIQSGELETVVAYTILPVVCSLCGIGITYMIWQNTFIAARKNMPDIVWWKFWPKAWKFTMDWDGYSFMFDFACTIGYVLAWIALAGSLLTEEWRSSTTLLLLILSSITTFPGYIPTIRQVLKNPHEEHWRPWTIWAIAYAFLCAAILMVGTTYPNSWNMMTWEREFIDWAAILSYPAFNVFICAFIAYLTRPSARAQSLQLI